MKRMINVFLRIGNYFRNVSGNVGDIEIYKWTSVPLSIIDSSNNRRQESKNTESRIYRCNRDPIGGGLRSISAERIVSRPLSIIRKVKLFTKSGQSAFSGCVSPRYVNSLPGILFDRRRSVHARFLREIPGIKYYSSDPWHTCRT